MLPRVPPIYEVTKRVGKGAYGEVWAAVYRPPDFPEGLSIAIKQVRPFNHRDACLRALREIVLLQHFDHENIVSLHHAWFSRYGYPDGEIYLVQDLMDFDLDYVIRTFRPLPRDKCQYIFYQILRGLKAIHSAGILHRDLKPSNILVNQSNVHTKICDFGLARKVGTSMPEARSLTEYVATRWYRAPEILLTAASYDRPIDIWSAGCILGEMLRGRPLLRGENPPDQLQRILQITRPSEANTAADTPRARVYPRAALKSLRLPLANEPTVVLASLCETNDSEALDLLHGMLRFSPALRISADSALHHPFVAVYHDPKDEPTVAIISPHKLSFEQDTSSAPSKAELFRIAERVIKETFRPECPIVNHSANPGHSSASAAEVPLKKSQPRPR